MCMPMMDKISNATTIVIAKRRKRNFYRGMESFILIFFNVRVFALVSHFAKMKKAPLLTIFASVGISLAK